jgi:ParB family transcriptional regulator, chromosome partitioning protein
MSKKLAEKAGLIKLPEAQVAAATSHVASPARQAVPEARARTAPGTMAAFLGTQSAAIREADELRQKVQQFDGALPVRKLDPRQVKGSRWANRSEASFASADKSAADSRR